MEIDFNNNWESNSLFKRWALIEISYESFNLTSHTQHALSFELLGFELNIFWKEYWI